MPELVVGPTDGANRRVFENPAGMAIGQTGDIYVLDGCSILQYGADGAFIRRFGNDHLSSPTAITSDDSDRLHVAQRSGLVVFNAHGDRIGGFNWTFETNFPRTVRVSRAGDIFIAWFEIMSQLIIHRFSPSGELLASFCDSYAKGKDVDWRVEQVLAGGTIDIDNDGHIYYTQIWPYEIRRFSAKGELVATISPINRHIASPVIEERSEEIVVGPVAGSFGIVVMNGPNKRILNVTRSPTSSTGKMVTVLDLFDPDGTLVASCRSTPELKLVCQDADGRLYGIDGDDKPKLVRYRLEMAEEPNVLGRQPK